MATENLGTLTTNLVAETGSFEAGMDRAQRALRATSKEAAYQGSQLEKLLGAIDPVTGALNKLDRQQQQLDAHFKSGRLPVDEYQRFTKILDTQKTSAIATEAALNKLSSSASKSGVSLNQTNAAMRQLPAQISDIFTSLAGGQNPLTVLLQQGSQIKDSFGGIGNTFDALGTKIKGIFGGSGTVAVDAFGAAAGAAGAAVKAAGKDAEAAGEGISGLAEGANTAADAAKNAKEGFTALSASSSGVTLGLGAILAGAVAVAAAIAAVGVAYAKGSSETTAYKNALDTTGNTAGATTAQLNVMAEAVAKSNGTVHEAAATLALLAASTKIPIESFQMIATAAANFEDATDKAASETVANFEKIAKDPSKAILDLNENLNFLSASTYEHIKSLQEQGKTQEAATLATTAYADALDKVSERINANLGTVERAWKAVKDGAKNAWDAILDIGREATFDEKMADLQKQLENAQRLGSGARGTGNRGVEQIQADINGAQFEEADKRRRAAAKGAAQQAQADALADQQILDKLQEDTYTNAEKRAKELEKYRLLVERRVTEARRTGDDSLLISAEQQAKTIANINDKYADKKEARAKAYVEDAGTRELDQAKQQYAVLQQQAMSIDEQTGKVKALGPAQQELIKWEQQLADIKNKETLTAAQKSLLAAADQITAQKALNAELEKDTAARALSLKQQQQLTEFTQAVADDTARFQKGLDNQVVGIGLGSEGRKRLQEDLALQNDYAEKVEKLRRDKLSGKITQETYDAETEILKEALATRLLAQQDNYRKLDAARAEWSNGMTAALQDYIREAGDVAGQSYNLFSDALKGIEDAFVTLATTGKLSFKSLADSIIADIARMAAKALIVQPLLSFIGLGGTANAAGSLALGSGSAGSGGGISLGSVYNAVSGAYNAVTSGFGSSVVSGFNTGGFSGAFSNGASYISNGISSFGAGSQAAVNTASIGASQAGYTGAQYSNYVAQQNAGQLAQTLGPYLSALSGAIMGWQRSGLKGAAAGAAGGYAGYQAGAAIGSYFMPGIGTAVGAVIGGILGSIGGSRLFAGDWVTKDQGIQLGVTAGSLDANSFEYQKKSGGLFGSNKKRTKLGELDTQTNDALQAAYDKTEEGVLDLVSKIGIDLPKSVFDGLSIAAQQISTKGKTQEEIQTAISAAFGSIADQMIQWIDMGTKGFGYSFEVLAQRIANFQSFNAALELLNVKMLALSPTSMELANDLITVSGGMEQFTKNVNAYYDAFFNSIEKSNTTLDTVKKQFDSLNIVLPDTREAYRAMVEGIDLTTEAGQKLFVSLTAAAGAAASAYDILEARQSTYYGAFYSEAENTARTISTITAEFKKANVTLPATRDGYRAMIEGIDRTTESGKKLYDTLMAMAGSADTFYTAQESAQAASRTAAMNGVSLAFSALQRAVSAQQAKLTAAYNAQVASLNDMLSTAQKNVSDLTSVASSLDAALKALRGTSDSAVKMLRQQALATLASAVATVQAGGTLAGFAGLDDALSTVSGNTTDLYSSLEQFNADQDRTANTIALLNEVNGKQLTSAEQTVKTLKDTLDQLQKDYDLQTQMLQAQIDYGQAQIDALNGVDTSVMSVTAAVAAMGAAIAAAIAAGARTPGATGGSGGYTGSGGGAGYNDINSIFNDVLGRDASISDAAYWAGQAANMSAAQLASQIRNDALLNGELQGRATGGSVSGLTWVGENGPEIIATGRANVYSAAQSKAIMSGSGSSIAEELQELRELTLAGLSQIAANTGETARNTKPIVRWDQNGLPATDPLSV